MFVKINKTIIFDTNTLFTYQLDDLGQLKIFNEYQYSNYTFDVSMIIWRQLLKDIVYENSKYLSVLHNPEECETLNKEFSEQLFKEFEEIEQLYTQYHNEMDYQNKEKEKLEYLDEGIDINDIEF